MVTIDVIDSGFRQLYLAIFDVLHGSLLAVLSGCSAAMRQAKAEQEAKKNFAIMASTDKTQRVFVSPT